MIPSASLLRSDCLHILAASLVAAIALGRQHLQHVLSGQYRPRCRHRYLLSWHGRELRRSHGRPDISGRLGHPCHADATRLLLDTKPRRWRTAGAASCTKMPQKRRKGFLLPSLRLFPGCELFGCRTVLQCFQKLIQKGVSGRLSVLRQPYPGPAGVPPNRAIEAG